MKKRIIIVLLVGFVLLNISAAFHGYRFTHFDTETTTKTDMDSLSFGEKLSILFMGISHPRPANDSLPKDNYEVISIEIEKGHLALWHIPVDSSKGTVVFFHGYSTSKSSMLQKAELIRKMGYSTYLVDFRGSGDSSGNSTTIGYREAEDVASVVNYLEERGEQEVYLFGTSMGSAAIIKAVAENDFNLAGIILECPFASLLQTAKNRFEVVGVPSFPAAYLLVFYGGIENGFWGFSHNPADYSTAIDTRTLLIFGEKDSRVKRFETDEIFENLQGEKKLLLFPEAGHLDFLEKDKKKWLDGVENFLR